MKKITLYPSKKETSYNGRSLDTVFTQAAENKFGTEIASLASKSFVRYVYGPTVIDYFRKDIRRGKYYNRVIQKKDPKAFEEYWQNRLRLQNIGKVVNFFYFLQTENLFLRTPGLIKKAENIIGRFTPYGKEGTDVTLLYDEKNYDRLKTKQKIALTKEVAKFAREICIRIIEAD